MISTHDIIFLLICYVAGVLAAAYFHCQSLKVELKRRVESSNYYRERWELRDDQLHTCYYKPINVGDRFHWYPPKSEYPFNTIKDQEVVIDRIMHFHNWNKSNRAFVVKSIERPDLGQFTVWESELKGVV